MSMPEYKKPLPAPDAVSNEFFESLKRHELKIQRCRACESCISPGRLRCPLCWSTDIEWVQAKGTGRIYTFAVMHQKYHPGFADEIPYNFALVELDEGVRIYGNIVNCPNDKIEVGMSVSVVFDDVTPDVTLARFRPEH